MKTRSNQTFTNVLSSIDPRIRRAIARALEAMRPPPRPAATEREDDDAEPAE